MNAYKLTGFTFILFLLVIPGLTVTFLEGESAGNSLMRGYEDPLTEFLYLPLILKDAGPPSTPTLYDIDNADGDGAYTINWSTSSLAVNYSLEEDDDTSFSSPTVVYSGSGVTKAMVGKSLGTYYYRVKAHNSFGSSEWSAVKSASVSQQPELICETHEFGTVGVAWPIYPSGRTEHFVAVNNMLVETVEVMSVLKALPPANVYVAIGINAEQLANKTHYVFSNVYTSYYINKDLTKALIAGDDIYYYISKAVGETEAWIKWGNYVKLCGR